MRNLWFQFMKKWQLLFNMTSGWDYERVLHPWPSEQECTVMACPLGWPAREQHSKVSCVLGRRWLVNCIIGDNIESVGSEMSTDLVREESFRTALRNQKRRLSATEKKPVVAEFAPGVNKSVLGNLKSRDSLTPPRRDFLTPPRNSFTPPR